MPNSSCLLPPLPGTHGHTVGGHCCCSTGRCPDTRRWPQSPSGGGSLHCNCTQPSCPPCTPCQTQFHFWEHRGDHRRELAEEKGCREHSDPRCPETTLSSLPSCLKNPSKDQQTKKAPLRKTTEEPSSEISERTNRRMGWRENWAHRSNTGKRLQLRPCREEPRGRLPSILPRWCSVEAFKPLLAEKNQVPLFLNEWGQSPLKESGVPRCRLAFQGMLFLIKVLLHFI